MPARNPATLTVALGERSYPIRVGRGESAAVLAALDGLRRERRPAFVVTDPVVAAAQPAFFEAARSTGAQVYTTSCNGEKAKEAEELARLWEALASARIDRTGVVIAAAGGVVGDLAGFAAASYLRGLDFIQMPTTLLAMVDSSVGGKTGINLAAGKNLAGAFHQPIAVYADTALLETLPEREFSAGMAEIIKSALLADFEFFEKLESLGALQWRHEALPEVIRRCCEIKAGVVGGDERETAADGGRALLNLGHTFGHAIENVAGYGEYLHGEAVAIGTVLAARLSAALGMLAGADVARIEKLVRTNKLPLALRASLPVEALMSVMQHDKKVRNGTLRFVVLGRLGKAQTHVVKDAALIREIWSGAQPGA